MEPSATCIKEEGAHAQPPQRTLTGEVDLEQVVVVDFTLGRPVLDADANELLGLVNRGPQEALAARVRKYQGYPD